MLQLPVRTAVVQLRRKLHVSIWHHNSAADSEPACDCPASEAASDGLFAYLPDAVYSLHVAVAHVPDCSVASDRFVC